jgi:hypothetical protein
MAKSLFDDYDGFVEKFKPKKTTDDCYTPEGIYDEVLAYCVERWGIDPGNVVRPFWPGADYQGAEYPEGCTVVDNPPFSKLAEIQAWYCERGIRFFLFCPSLTALSGRRCMEVDHIVCDFTCVYHNGATVHTGFVTNLDEEHVLEADPELGRRLNAKMDEVTKAGKTSLPKYEYPPEVLTSARAQWIASHGTALKVRRADCCRVSKLDAQAALGKTVFGGGLLLNSRAAAERAAAERAAAERAAAHVWELSERERAIIGLMDERAEGEGA